MTFPFGAGDSRPLWRSIAVYWAAAASLYAMCAALGGRALPAWASSAVAAASLAGLFGLLLRQRRERYPSGARTTGERVAVAALYALAALTFFLPVLSHVAVETLGGGDGLEVLWNAWWLERAARTGLNPLFTDMVFAPDGAPLAFHMLVPLESSLVALLEPLTGAPLAYNLMIFGAFPLAGSACYWLARELGWSPAASAVGGLVLMWSPFLSSKLQWPNHAYCGLLALFALALMRATPLAGEPPSRRAQAELALSVLLLQLASDVLLVFAANLAFVRFASAAHAMRSLRRPLAQWLRACAPAAAAAFPYLALIASYALRFEFDVQRRRTIGPGLADLALPLFQGSLHRGWVSALLGFDQPARNPADVACYLGLVALPLAVIGLARARRSREVRFWIALLAFALAMSLGPRLAIGTEPVEVLGRRVPLPFAIWGRVPLLGMVSQPGRYLVLAYLAIGLGVAAALHSVGERFGVARMRACAVLAAAAIALDFAFVPRLSALPERSPLEGRSGRVLDARIYEPEMMYQQTLHGRPLVGGYLSRPPLGAIRRYRSDECVGWLMFGVPPRPPCTRERLLVALAALDVTDVVLGGRAPQAAELERFGFQRVPGTHRGDVFRVPTVERSEGVSRVWEIARAGVRHVRVAARGELNCPPPPNGHRAPQAP